MKTPLHKKAPYGEYNIMGNALPETVPIVSYTLYSKTQQIVVPLIWL